MEGLCQLVRAIGYKDPMRRQSLSSRACLGDLIEFLSDNPGAIEAVVSWIGEQEVPEWDDAIEGCISDEDEDEDEDEEADEDVLKKSFEEDRAYSDSEHFH